MHDVGPNVTVGGKQAGMADLTTLSGHLGALAWAAIRALAGMLLLFVAAGWILGAASYLCLKENTFYACLFAGLAFAEAAAVGIFMGQKRAIVSALATGVGRAQLGSSAARSSRYALIAC